MKLRSNFGFSWFFLWLMAMLMPAQALQRDHLFARHFHISSAASAVRDLGSGGDACSVPELNDGPYTSCTMCTLVPDLSSLPAGIHRFGEARNPGPHQEDLLTVGVSNPCGLRRKEDVLLGLGPGIWSLAETHLSQQTFRTCSGILRKGAQQLNRQVRFHGGAPAPLRQGSTWAGTWTGVAVLSDHATTPLNIPWPAEQWESGRVLLTRHWVAATPITVGTFYGYARGPTWPRARQLSDQLLENFTTEVILGMSGVRLIMGDFNQEAGQLVQQQIWLRHGWRNAQQLAEEMLNHNPFPHAKGPHLLIKYGCHQRQFIFFVGYRSQRTFWTIQLLRLLCTSHQSQSRCFDGPGQQRYPGKVSLFMDGNRSVRLTLFLERTQPPLCSDGPSLLSRVFANRRLVRMGLFFPNNAVVGLKGFCRQNSLWHLQPARLVEKVRLSSSTPWWELLQESGLGS